MQFEIKPLLFKPHRLNGFSAALIVNHYEKNYGGALQRLNAIAQTQESIDWARTPSYQANGLGREWLLAYNSVLLHEHYFSAFGGDGVMEPGRLAQEIEQSFGSIDGWLTEFTARGRALGGGSGWLILAWSPRAQRLVHQWSADHAHFMADAEPVLVLDLYEHAYQRDFGPDVASYISCFLRNLDWPRLSAQFQNKQVRKEREPDAQDFFISPEALHQILSKDHKRVLLLDVRLQEDFAEEPVLILGAEWRNPLTVADWADIAASDQPVVAYCHYGMQVCQEVVKTLRQRGIDAKALTGGISAWRAMGGQVKQ